MLPWKSLNANGIELAYLSSESEGEHEQDRGLVIYLHGFPDTARAFEFMLEPTARSGWHGISLETRGYPPSGLASEARAADSKEADRASEAGDSTNADHPGDYSVPTLAADVAETIAALGYERAVLVGHDWGAVIAAGVAAYFPERVRAVALVGFPHISKVKVTLGGLLRRPHHLLFQFGAFGRWLTARNDLAYIHRMYAVWSPSWNVPPEYLERVKAALRAPERLRAALEYYVQIWQRRNDREMLARLAQRVNAPGLVIGGLDEPDFRQRWLEESRDCFTPQAPIEMWEAVGHWPHSEAPAKFERRMVEFLGGL